MRIQDSIIKPLEPKGFEWMRNSRNIQDFTMGYPSVLWTSHAGFMVISAVEVMTDFDGVDLGPQYHVSVSFRGDRCTRNQAKFVLSEFGMQDADEDNHVPGGFVRNYFKPVAEKFIGYECPCKETETAVKENKGDYVWRGINK